MTEEINKRSSSPIGIIVKRIGFSIVVISAIAMLVYIASGRQNPNDLTVQQKNPVDFSTLTPIFLTLEAAPQQIYPLETQIASLKTQSAPLEQIAPLETQVAGLQSQAAAIKTTFEAQIETLRAQSVSDTEFQTAIAPQVAQVETLESGLETLESKSLSEEQVMTLIANVQATQNAISTQTQSAFNVAATQTQEAMVCIVTPLYSSITAYHLPTVTARRISFLYQNQHYKVIARTEGPLNTESMWWLVEINPLDHSRGWVQSIMVSEDSDVTCLRLPLTLQ